MTKNIGLPWNSLPVEKEDCCEAHLRPLLERIDHLEGRLLVETERRENEYNELLKMFLTIKREQRKDTEAGHTAELSVRNRQSSKASRKITSPSPRIPVTKLPLNPNRRGKDEPKLKSILINQSAVSRLPDADSVPSIDKRVADCENGMVKQQSELDKIKELNDYLMGQLLSMFEKMREFEELFESVKKNVNSEETVTSMVIDQESRSPRPEMGNKEHKTSSWSNLSDLSKAELGEVAARVTEHEGMLADLIQLTKTLSSQIRSWGISPRAE